jgi:4-aminobutyrate aminotransferase/(S)-3-amino-2-methylpropionate transaminase
VIEDEGLVERSAALGETMRARMEAWRGRFPQVGDVRGLGSMLAIELVDDRESKRPATELASRVITEALGRGLLLLRSGVHGNCIRVLVPLVISDPELDEALQVWEDALAAAL